MHLLYVDESGAVADDSQRYFILAGVAVFERNTHWIEQKLNALVATIDPEAPHEIELHGSPIRSGKGFWRRKAPEQRVQLIKDALNDGINAFRQDSVRLFACVVEKDALSTTDPVHYCFEQIAMRFDQFLGRRHARYDDTQRGLMLFDKSCTEQRLQTLAREFKRRGHSYGKTRNYAEVPVFLDSHATRLIQLADLVAFSTFRFFEHGDAQYFDLIKHRFDEQDGIQYGLHVLQVSQTPD